MEAYDIWRDELTDEEYRAWKRLMQKINAVELPLAAGDKLFIEKLIRPLSEEDQQKALRYYNYVWVEAALVANQPTHRGEQAGRNAANSWLREFFD